MESENEDTGRAALVSINLDAPDDDGALWTVFEERFDDEPHQHPVARCWALWESIEADWPGHKAAVIANARARNLKSAYTTSHLLGTDYERALADLEADRVAARAG